jgi:hypothetical protein
MVQARIHRQSLSSLKILKGLLSISTERLVVEGCFNVTSLVIVDLKNRSVSNGDVLVEIEALCFGVCVEY